jgi:class 3 adenylate cyclase/tetratricopeptide (TPR) repeat protein
MKCPKCRFENREGARFCKECGGKLELSCPTCGSAYTSGTKFCDQCGQSLSEPASPAPKGISFDKKLSKIQRYLPKGLTEKILSQRDKIEGERRQVTVMFCDLEGFTPLVERIGAEEAYGVMDQVYELLIHKVHDYEGTVNEMTGDGILALFGAPIALEDAPQRAIRSALAIHREMARFSDRLRQEREDIPPLKMRIGIHSGPVVVGTLGNNLRVEFKAVGDTVNLASRMEGLADPGTIYVTEDVFKLTEGLFRFEALGERVVKGKEAPLRVYQVIAPTTRRTRFDVSAERGLTPFVGRQRELELFLEGFHRAKEGRGQAFSIMAEAGVGKSRLLYEFRKAIANEDVTFLEGNCLSYARNATYGLVMDLVKSIFNVMDGEDSSITREKVGTGLKNLRIKDETIYSSIAELVSAPEEGGVQTAMSPEGRKDRLIESMKRIMIQASERRPLVIAIEDLHWVDKSSEDCIRVLLDTIYGSKVFLILTYRPEYVPLWPAKSYHSHVTLNRLSNRESLTVVFNLLETETVEKDLEELLLDKTEGVPFFIEEFIKSLKELKIIERTDGRYRLAKDIQALAIPSTIQAVILARVDALPETAKDVVQTGAAIEREFSYDLIKRIMKLPEKELISNLSVLKDSELLYERGVFPKSTYIFKHALTREVIYESVLKKKRILLHQEIAQAIEELYGDNIGEHYGLLAGHFIEAEDYEKGAKYSWLAAKKANNLSAWKEIFYHAQRRIQCSEKLPPSDETSRKIIDARTSLSAFCVNYSHLAEAYELIKPIADLAEKMGYEKQLPMILLAKGQFACHFEEEASTGLEYLRKALELSLKTGNMIYHFHACWHMGVVLSRACQFAEGRRYFEKMLEISEAVNSLLGISSANRAISLWTYLEEGKIDLASQSSIKSLAAAEKSGDTYSRGLAYCAQGTVSYFRGIPHEAEQDILKGLKYLETTSQVTFIAEGLGCLGQIYLDRGDYEGAYDCWEKAKFLLLEQGGLSPSWINTLSANMAKAKLLSQGEAVNLGELFGYYSRNRLKTAEGQMARTIGEILYHLDGRHFSEAQEWIEKAIEADRRNGMMWHLARDYAVYAEFFMRRNDTTAAKETFGNAIDLFMNCGADGWVERYQKALAVL